MTERRKVVLVNDTTSARHHGCAAVMAALLDGCAAAQFDIIHRHPAGIDWRESTATIQKIQSADLVLVNGEGSIHHDNRRTVALAALGPYCRERRTAAVLINASLYALKVTLADLGAYRMVFTRDTWSANFAQNAGIVARAVGDLSFAHDLSTPIEPSPQPVFTDSVVRRDAVRLRQDAEVLHSDVLPIRTDLAVPDFYAYVRLLGAYGFVVTGRYHAACFCINAGIPFVALPSNTNKIEALTADVFGTSARILTPNALHSMRSDLFALFERLTYQRRDVSSRTLELRERLAPFQDYSTEEQTRREAYKVQTRAAIAAMWQSIGEL